MKTRKTVLKLIYTQKEETEPAVFENVTHSQTVKATQESIFASRQDRANRDGLVLTARFSVRSQLVTDEFNYAEWNDGKYKLSSVTQSDTAHETIIELGGRI